MTTVISNDVSNPPAVALLTRKGAERLPAIPAGPAAFSAGPPMLRDDYGAQRKLLLHIACQPGGHIGAGLPTHYLCGAQVRVLLGEITPGDGPDGPGICRICAALDHPGQRPAQSSGTNVGRAPWPAAAHMLPRSRRA